MSMFKRLFLVAILSGASLAKAKTDYSYVDPQHEVPEVALSEALHYYDLNKAKLTNPNFLTVIDYSQHSGQRRMFIVNMQSGLVEKFFVAHGRESDPEYTGLATRFSNIVNSKMSSVGFYLTAEPYHGEHGLSLMLDGLSQTNNNARARAIVVHGADYVHEGLDKMGRSWGCPAVDQKHIEHIVTEIQGGSLMLGWAGSDIAFE